MGLQSLRRTAEDEAYDRFERENPARFRKFAASREARLLDTLGKTLGPVIRELTERIEQLEADAAHIKAFGWRGTWEPGQVHQRGHLVTSSGGLWHCERSDVTSKPGSDSGDWRLCVKRGRR